MDLGETEKNWDRRLGLTEGALMEIPPFPEEGEKDGELLELLGEVLLNRRGIAEGSSESAWGVCGRIFDPSTTAKACDGPSTRLVRQLEQGLLRGKGREMKPSGCHRVMFRGVGLLVFRLQVRRWSRANNWEWLAVCLAFN